MKISFNAPVTLMLTVSALIVMILAQTTQGYSTTNLFSTYPTSQFDALTFVRMFTHILGHAGWDHFLANFTLILVLGPLLEERHGSVQLFGMILITAFVTALLNNIFFTNGLLGASGVVFMMILLSSITNIRSKTIPATFLIVVVLFLGREIVNSLTNDNISQFAHIVGGICGSFFGFFKKSDNTQQTVHL